MVQNAMTAHVCVGGSTKVFNCDFTLKARCCSVCKVWTILAFSFVCVSAKRSADDRCPSIWPRQTHQNESDVYTESLGLGGTRQNEANQSVQLSLQLDVGFILACN